MPDVYLDEAQFGAATGKVAFPHLLVCIGFVALTGNEMFGMHSDVQADTFVLATELNNFMANRGVVGGNIVALYGCGDWTNRYGSAARLAWEEEMRLVARALGFHGPARGFDTGIIAPQNGTYAEYLPLYPQQRCRIFYKGNEKMVYQSTTRTPITYNPDIKKLHTYGGTTNVTYETTGGDIIQTLGNMGDLHEVDYNTRLVSFNIP